VVISALFRGKGPNPPWRAGGRGAKPQQLARTWPAIFSPIDFRISRVFMRARREKDPPAQRAALFWPPEAGPPGSVKKCPGATRPLPTLGPSTYPGTLRSQGKQGFWPQIPRLPIEREPNNRSSLWARKNRLDDPVPIFSLKNNLICFTSYLFHV